jgi:glycosyltransferase involved in cell wall biosynthesis
MNATANAIMEHFRLHVVNLPHTEVTEQYMSCAYTQKTLKFCKMMKSLGHEVFLYAGGEKTDAPVDEFVSCISKEDQIKYFGATDITKDFYPIEWNETLPYWQTMNNNAATEIRKRAQQTDIICLIGGSCQKPIADQLKEFQIVEFGIGYQGVFSSFKIFESYAWMHNVYGLQKIENGQYYDSVIPNYFDEKDFPYSEEQDDYYLYIGRMVSRKGVHIAAEVVGKIGGKLKLAGQGIIKHEGNVLTSREFEISGDHLEYLGTVGKEERGRLMSRAKAVFVPTQYIGPFEGVSIEAMLCGTPVITTDWGCFAENVIDGFNGYRTRTMGEMMWAAKNVDKLDRKAIREWAIKNFSMDRVKYQYQAYFEQLKQLWDKGWYSEEYDPTNRRYQRFI